MKKNVKRILLIVIGLFLLFAGVQLAFHFPMLLMKPAETGQVPGTNIYIVKNKIGAVFFIKTDSGYIMIDSVSDINTLKTSLEENKISINDVKWIFLTHSDYDHVAGLALFPNADIFMSEDELQLIDGTSKRSPFGGNKMPSGADIGKIILLQDGQEFLFNATQIKSIKTPGHTNGSMAYLVDGQYLFTGDAFKIKNVNISVHPYTMDKNLAKKTIEQLTETISNSSIVLTSHYGLYYKK